MSSSIKKIIIGFAGATILATAANAGGFSRGTADTDILFEDGNFNMRAGVTIVNPNVKYDTINGAAASDGKYSDSYAIPNAAIKLKLHDNLSCAGTVTQSFGAGATYGPEAVAAGLLTGHGVKSEGFTSNELGLTCGANLAVGPGRAWVIGGLYMQDFDYSQTVTLNARTPFGLSNTDATLAFKDEYRLGYRLGVAYEIPEIALRAQLLYRSEVHHTPGVDVGSFTTLVRAFPAFGEGTLPQSVELKLQSGVAPGWLVFGSVKWTDWSVLDTLNYTIVGPAPVFGNVTELEYAWRDGWTVSAGVGHQFNDNLSGQAALTWDRGVSTTEDNLRDTWGLAGGVALSNDSKTATLSLGGGITYLSGGSVAQQTVAHNIGTIEEGDSFAYTSKGSWAYALGGSFKIKF
ncbi:outer membrane protein transport protein [Ahrensia kielensis]|uniref:Outer membrane protein transport protein n=1 Tax=Ahrensia kielensis TaxID=76980 RepID=A0ABU9T6K9_9HYPH